MVYVQLLANSCVQQTSPPQLKLHVPRNLRSQFWKQLLHDEYGNRKKIVTSAIRAVPVMYIEDLNLCCRL